MATPAAKQRTTMAQNGCKASETADNRKDRLEWAKMMRKRFSPQDMIFDDGEINQEFFRPTQVVLLDSHKWGAEENDLLIKGLEVYGIGKWREIGEELLPQWDDQALRVKACRLLGSQSLARYVGWKGDRAAIEEEFQKNREVGEATGCWKSGMLVEDDGGSVKKALEGLS